MSRFIVYWLDGTSEEMSGATIADAFMRAGYGGGAMRAIDYWKEVTA